MARLGIPVDSRGRAVPIADATGVRGDPLAFRQLASQLGVVLAPRLLTPSDTLGFSGFQLTTDIAFTGIDSSAAYWRALAASPNPSGEAGNNAPHGDALLQTVGVFVRKGIWFPLPSFEVGLGFTHLRNSGIWAAQGYAKLAVLEGYHDLPAPSIALRAAASRAMGTEQLDLTVASFDVTASKDIGIRGTFTLSPYLGWNLLWIIPRSDVIDKTPHIDATTTPNDTSMLFSFTEQDAIRRQRLFVGLKFAYYIFTATFEATHAFSGNSTDDVPRTAMSCTDVDPLQPTSTCDATDSAAAQTTYAVSIGFDF